MTRIAYRPLQQMTERACELTLERGNLNVYRALANAENTYTGWMAAGRAALASLVLPARLREIIILRIAHLMDCPYELGQHLTLAGAAGMSPQEIAALVSDSASLAADFTEVERAVVELTTQLLTTRQATEGAVHEVYTALGAEAMIEVLMIINRWAGLALMLNALEVDLDETARLAIPPAERSSP
jgi:AhpD family alkylhydroperoxidase